MTEGLIDFAVIIPVFNEGKVIVETIERVRNACAQVAHVKTTIVCVNDGSTDNTAEALRAVEGIEVLTHPMNRGYGAALRTGIDSVSADWIAIVDADSTYPIEDMPKLLQFALEGYDMVVGERKGLGITMAPHKRLARLILKSIARTLTGVYIPDLNSGMRIFQKELYIQFRHLLPPGFSFTTTITVAALYSGYRIRFVPIDYAKRAGKSHIKPFQDFLAFTMLIVRLATYFEPLRFFIPLFGVFFLLSLMRGVRDVFVVGHIGGVAILLMVLAMQIFVSGMIADLIVTRSYTKLPPTVPLSVRRRLSKQFFINKDG